MADILVADDTRSIRSTLSLLLEEEGHTVRLAPDGESALAEYRRKRPDMLLLDVMMPKKNGYQVLKQIRRDDPGMREFGFTADDFVVRVSDREVWLRYAAEHGVPEEKTGDFLAVIDKFERDRPEVCQEKLDAFGMKRADLEAFIQNPPAGCSPRYEAVLAELAARGLADYVKLDLYVVRGLAYYTGLVFEIFDKGHSLRAIAGGGRYNGLVSTLSNGAVDMPATGFAMGDAVIAHLIEACPAARALRDAAVKPNACDVCLVLAAAEMRPQMLALASSLRDAGVRVDLPLSPAKMGNQLKRAEKIGATYAVIVGSEYPELELKNLSTRESVKTDIEALLEELLPDAE